MTQDEIIRMAKNEYGIYAFTAESLAEFATITAAAEREACAKVCLEEAPSLDGQLCAEAIRARGNK